MIREQTIPFSEKTKLNSVNVTCNFVTLAIGKLDVFL